MKIKLQDLEKQKYILHALGLKEENLLTPITKVKTKIRVATIIRNTDKLENWIDTTLILSVEKSKKSQVKVICYISIEDFEWAGYTLEDFDKKDCTFMSEEYLMQIDYVGRPPDEIIERNQEQERRGMLEFIQDTLNNL